MSLKVLFLGGSSFLGRNLMSHLIKDDFEVFTFVRSQESKNRILAEIPSCKIIAPADLGKYKFDYALNLIVDYGRNSKNPSEVYQTNVNVPLHLLKTIRAKTIINFSTGLPESLSHYASTKRELERELFSCFADTETQVLNLRLQQFFGPGATEENFIIYLIKNLLSGAELRLTDCEHKRDLIYLPDLIDAILLIMKKANMLKKQETIEIGSGASYRLKDVVDFLAQATSSTSSIKFGAIPKRPNEPDEIKADVSVIKQIGWEVKTDFHMALLSTISFYNNHHLTLKDSV